MDTMGGLMMPASIFAAASTGGLGGGNWSFIYMGLGIVMVTWFMNTIREAVTLMYGWIHSRFYYTARISHPDPAFIWVLEWLSIQPTVFGSRSVSVMTRMSEKSARPSFTLLPMGTQWIKFNGKLVHIVRQVAQKTSRDGVSRDCIDITILFGNTDLLNNLVHDAMEYSVNLNKDKTKIYTLEPHSQFWECITIQPKRVVDSVILDLKVRNHIMSDVGAFINGKEWYVNTGVPYRRGYLLYGPPGTGKTSFILSIAGKFGLSISIMNMSKGIHDGNIHSIVQKTPNENILVLEDIDAAFVKRQGQKNDVLTFSGLLNALDGLASSDGRILIMTTNHIERLSPALIRPGRIDVKVMFDYATEYQVTQMFQRFFATNHHWMIKRILEIFGKTKISTAQLQGWFIIHRDTPALLLDNIHEFLDQCNKEHNTSNFYNHDSSNNTNNNNPNNSNGSSRPTTPNSSQSTVDSQNQLNGANYNILNNNKIIKDFDTTSNSSSGSGSANSAAIATSIDTDTDHGDSDEEEDEEEEEPENEEGEQQPFISHLAPPNTTVYRRTNSVQANV